MHPSLGLCQGHLSMRAQSPINLYRSLERLLPMMMMMTVPSGRASRFIMIWCPGGLFLRRSPDPDPYPAPAHVSDASPGPSSPRAPANGEDSYLSRECDSYAFMVPAARSLPRSSAAKERSRVPARKPTPPPQDASCPVKGMYRLLDLINEQGSSGLGNRPFLGYY
jgi:hypothetical protein